MDESVIAIKDFEMPEKCSQCGFKTLIQHKHTYWVCWVAKPKIDMGVRLGDSRHPSCPLVEIPDYVG